MPYGVQMPTERNDDFVNLCECHDVIAARSLEAALRGSGIPCVIKGLSHREQFGMLGTHIDLRVLVKREDFAVARAIVANYGSAPTLYEEDLPDELRPDDEEENRGDENPDAGENEGVRGEAEDSPARRARDRTALFWAMFTGFGVGYFHRGNTALGVLFAVWQVLALRHFAVADHWTGSALVLMVRILEPLSLWLLTRPAKAPTADGGARPG